MNVQKSGRLIAAWMGMAAISMTAVQAAASQMPAKPDAAKSPVPAVTVKLGDAMLEEYHGGNPASRTTTLRGGDVAPKAKPAGSGKKHS